MLLLSCLLLLPGPIEVAESPDFPRQLQLRAITATVRIVNPITKMDGSGVIVGKQGSFVYLLTAHHLVKDADTVDVEVFSEKSYPKAEKIYRSGRVVAKAADIRDLALIRLPTDDPLPAPLLIAPVADVPKGAGFPGLTTGCSQGQAPSALTIKVLGKKKVSRQVGGETAYFWESNERVTPGRSGGPILDKRGKIIGICSGTNDGKGYFTHPDEIHRFLKQNAFQWLVEK